VIPKGEVVRLVADTLASMGFNVALNFRVRGLSGYWHTFDIMARREYGLLIDVPGSIFELLASMAKRTDVRGFRLLTLVDGSSLQIPPELLKGVGLVLFDGPEDLRGKLLQLASQLPP